MADPSSVDACAERLITDRVDVDILVNNAGIYPTTPILRVDERTMREALEINLLGAWRTCRAFVPAMVERGWGRVVNVSSGGGAICEGTPGPGAYGISKTALNALTREVADAAGRRVKVNAICPGWVATDMGGPHAPVSVEEACDTLVWLATLPDDDPTNGFFGNRRPIPW
ncbi:MAG: SDR family NAD(P)-dependent oxidoreductase [Acidimicrobiales bacterium]